MSSLVRKYEKTQFMEWRCSSLTRNRERCCLQPKMPKIIIYRFDLTDRYMLCFMTHGMCCLHWPFCMPPAAAMADEDEGGKVAVRQPKAKMLLRLLVLLRVAVALAAAAAAVLMGLNQQTRVVAVATLGTTPIYKTFTAKFQQTPAFVYFVIANAVASFYNTAALLFRQHFKTKTADIPLHLMDMVILSVIATGAAAAASMAELGKHGNLHARWNPICDRYEVFCFHGGLALASSFVGALLQLLIIGISAITLHNHVANQD